MVISDNFCFKVAGISLRFAYCMIEDETTTHFFDGCQFDLNLRSHLSPECLEEPVEKRQGDLGINSQDY